MQQNYIQLLPVCSLEWKLKTSNWQLATIFATDRYLFGSKLISFHSFKRSVNTQNPKPLSCDFFFLRMEKECTSFHNRLTACDLRNASGRVEYFHSIQIQYVTSYESE